MGDQEQVQVRVEHSILDIDAEAWDLCANPDPANYNPFVSHAFLQALEQSGSVSEETGWYPQHLVLDDGGGRALGCMPCYLKSHSRGEYVFDHAWADAYERAGGAYYPKLQSAVPFTPVTGRRLLVPKCGDAHSREKILAHKNILARENILARAACELTVELGLSSFHMTFLTKAEWEGLGALGFLQRRDQQFHWENQSYSSFDAFLASLSSRKRKTIHKERRDALAGGVEIEWVTGSDIREEHWDAFFDFYMDTSERKWGVPYLNREFFSLVSQSLANKILLIMCKRDGRWIGGALNFIGGDTLFGRYWGANEEHRFLHFEACYYQAIDFAIAHRLAYVEAGAQGTHKLARGYLPQETYSAHFISDPGFRKAIDDFLMRENVFGALEAETLQSFSPYKKTPSGGENT